MLGDFSQRPGECLPRKIKELDLWVPLLRSVWVHHPSPYHFVTSPKNGQLSLSSPLPSTHRTPCQAKGPQGTGEKGKTRTWLPRDCHPDPLENPCCVHFFAYKMKGLNRGTGFSRPNILGPTNHTTASQRPVTCISSLVVV